MKSWIIVLASAAGMGLLSEDAFAADRSRSSSSSPRHSSSSSHQSRHHHSQPHRHRHHHSHGAGIVVVPSFWAWPYYYPAPVYAAPAVAPPLNGGYWYFCPDSRAYYPYVAECRSAWLAVVPGSEPPN